MKQTLLLLLCFFLAISAKTQEKQKVYVWDFTSENIPNTALAKQITDEFEEQLIASKTYTVLDRRNYANFIKHNQNEKDIQDANDIPAGAKQQLLTNKADLVIFGNLIASTSGKYKLSIKLQNLTTSEIVQKPADYYPPSDFNDDYKRKALIEFFVCRLTTNGGCGENNTGNTNQLSEIIEKHVEAVGGREKIKGIKTEYMEGYMDFGGSLNPMSSYVLNGRALKNEVVFMGQKFINCLTNSEGWQILGNTPLQKFPDEFVRGAQYSLKVEGPLVDFVTNGSRCTLSGIEDLDGKNVYKLEMITKENSQVTIFIDTKTYYIVKEVFRIIVNGLVAQGSQEFSNFKKTDYGFVAPLTIKVVDNLKGTTTMITYNKVDINKEIDPVIFKMPGSP